MPKVNEFELSIHRWTFGISGAKFQGCLQLLGEGHHQRKTYKSDVISARLSEPWVGQVAPKKYGKMEKHIDKNMTYMLRTTADYKQWMRRVNRVPPHDIRAQVAVDACHVERWMVHMGESLLLHWLNHSFAVWFSTWLNPCSHAAVRLKVWGGFRPKSHSKKHATRNGWPFELCA